MLKTISTTKQATSLFHELAAYNIIIGLTASALPLMTRRDHVSKGTEMSKGTEALNSYIQQFPLIEVHIVLPDLPSPETLRLAIGQPGLQVLWHVSIPEIDKEHGFFTRPEWGQFVSTLQEYALSRHHVVFSLDRSIEYTAERLERLLIICESVYPLTAALEFEHGSWKKAERTLMQLGIPRVELDAPKLPGIVKRINTDNRQRGYIRAVGRNAKTWFESSTSDRFCYSYTDSDLQELTTRILTLHESTDRLYVILSHFPAENAFEDAKRLAGRISISISNNIQKHLFGQL